jgi:hypothetical protein
VRLGRSNWLQNSVPSADSFVFRAGDSQALGARVATLTFTDTATNSPQAVPLTGTGVGKS